MELELLSKDIRELNFTAIDFETANEQRGSICSLGIIVVQNGNIIEQHQFLIKPYEMRFTELNSRIHGITEKDVMNSPEFNEVWKNINKFIINRLILAHNASFDIEVLKQGLSIYNLPLPNLRYVCTQKLSQAAFTNLDNYRLTDVAKYLGLDHNHHNSLSDAMIAAAIGVKALPIIDKTILDYKNEEITGRIIRLKSAEKIDRNPSKFDSKKINSELLKPNLNVDNKDNPFYNKKVVFTGDLKTIGRKEAATKIQGLGADINTAISKKTEIVVIGEGAGPTKMKKIDDLICDGCQIRIIYEEEFLSIINKS